MKKISIYLDFLKEKGRLLSEINSGSDEIALATDDALQALNLLNDNQVPILGGDILSEKENGSLVYACQLWGSEYYYLNWYCNKINNENQEDYTNRSYIIAKKSIKTANNIAKRLGKKCYIVIVI
jgi:hypothetical protein